MNSAASTGRTVGTRATARKAWKLPEGSWLREACGSAGLGAAASLLMLAAGLGLIRAEAMAAEATRLEAARALHAHDALIAAAPLDVLPLDEMVRGRGLFTDNCAACHKPDGTGIENLGKDLTRSWFVASRDDAKLAAFVSRGRPTGDPLNTTGVAMPPRGGHDELNDEDLAVIVRYVRGLQDPRRMPVLPAAVAAAPAAPSEAQKAAALAAAGGDAELAEFIAHGTTLFASTCAACHGKDAKGMQGLGKDLVNSEFCKKLDDDGLLAFVKRGRDPSDPLNTTKVGMPPKGGNPALSDDDLLDVIAYVRSLQKQGSSAQ